jgi:inorganic triphosphatase YgiF
VPTEVELKYTTSDENFTLLRKRLTTSNSLLSEFGAVDYKVSVHKDTYYCDKDNRIHERKGSLRVREFQDRATRVTLKLPSSGGVSQNAIERTEIESTGPEDAQRTLNEIVNNLVRLEILEPDQSEVRRIDLLGDGLRGTVARLGLDEVFTVVTTRESWNLTHNDTVFAELALDSSEYHFKTGGELRSQQIEIELTSLDHAYLVDRVHRLVTGKPFDLEPTPESKFERGWAYVCATRHEEKVEAKLAIDSSESEEIANWLRRPPVTIGDYAVRGQGIRTEISDRYYDTESFELAKNGYYLRLRTEKGKTRMVLRQLTNKSVAGLIQQGEIKSEDESGGFRDSLAAIESHLVAIIGKHKASAETAAKPESRLAQIGLKEAMELTIKRTSWIVITSDPRSPNTETPQVAKIKYDQITAKRDNGKNEYKEIEVTGLEDHPSSPGEFSVNHFKRFLDVFSIECARRLANRFEVNRIVDAKYFAMLRNFGILDSDITSFAGEAALRQSFDPLDSTVTRRASFEVAIPLLFAGTALALIPYSRLLNGALSYITEGIAIVAVICAGVSLFIPSRRDSPSPLSLDASKAVAVLIAVILCVVLVLRNDLTTAAEILAVISFPLGVLAILGVDVRRQRRR